MARPDLIVGAVSVVIYAGAVFRGARHDHDTAYRLPLFWAESVVKRGLGRFEPSKQEPQRLAS
jgi:hypothetical protein